MKKLLLLSIIALVLSSFTDWQQSFETARQIARKEHRLILLNFSGSDWCGPCIRMRKEIFESEAFISTADSLLVLVNADFPRNKKNQLSKSLQQQNDQLAEKYNPEGKFPFTLLIDENGKTVQSWEGLPRQSAKQFSDDIKAIVNARK